MDMHPKRICEACHGLGTPGSGVQDRGRFGIFQALEILPWISGPAKVIDNHEA